MYYDYFEDKNNDKCNSNKPDCKEVIKMYHALIKESDALYDAANYIIDKEAAGEICDALKALTKAFKLNQKAEEKQKKANMLLDKTNCDKKCNRKSSKCYEILCTTKELYKKEENHLCKAGDLLKAALEEIEKSIKLRNICDALYKDYKKCVHHKEGRKDPDCQNKKENPFKKYYQ